MKTTVVLTFLFASAGLFFNSKPGNFENTGIAAVKATKAKRNAEVKPKAPLRIIVDKSDYELYVYDAEGWYATYPVVFGNNTLDDKKMEGDKNTPEGSFKIVSKRVHEKWNRYMGLNYPTEESLEKFKKRKAKGEIPSSASPGGGIGLHGTWPHEDFVIDRYKNWTNGCISLKNRDIQDLYSYVPVGTTVTIRK